MNFALASELPLLKAAFGPSLCSTVVVETEQFNDTEKEIRQASRGAVLHNLLQRPATASLVRENDAVRETLGRLESDTDPEVRFHLHEVALLLQV